MRVAGVGESTMGCRPCWASLRDVPEPGGTQRAGAVAAAALHLPCCSAAVAEPPAWAWVCFKIISGFAVTSLQSGRKPQQGPGVCGSCTVPALGVESSCAVGMGQERGCGSGAVGLCWVSAAGSKGPCRASGTGVQKRTRALDPTSVGKCISHDANMSSAGSRCALVGWGHRLPPSDKYILETRGRFCCLCAVGTVSGRGGQGCSCLLRACLRAAPSHGALHAQPLAPSSGQ